MGVEECLSGLDDASQPAKTREKRAWLRMWKARGRELGKHGFECKLRKTKHKEIQGSKQRRTTGWWRAKWGRQSKGGKFRGRMDAFGLSILVVWAAVRLLYGTVDSSRRLSCNRM